MAHLKRKPSIIQSGLAKGMPLASPKGQDTRPTTARVREAMMSILRPHFPKARVLDLFAGTGALGLEALSNGAQELMLVEKDGQCFKALKENIDHLSKRLPNLKRPQAYCMDGVRFLAKNQDQAFDIVFLDPPYAYWSTFSESFWLSVRGVLAKGAGVMLEAPSGQKILGFQEVGFQLVREKSYGKTSLWLLTL